MDEIVTRKNSTKAQKTRFAELTRILMAKDKEPARRFPEGPIDDAFFEGLPDDERPSGEVLQGVF